MYQKKLGFILFVIIFAVIFSTVKLNTALAATLSNVSDTITTSRPSPSTPLSADAASSVGSVSVYNNGSIFLASDSAHFFGGTAENVNVSTMSAALTTLFFTGTTANAHLNGTVVAAPITAMHKVQFTTQTVIPSGGSIVISLPNTNSSDTNEASPSASTFMFNGLITSNASTNIQSNNATTCTYTITQSAGGVSTIECDVSSSISAGTVVTFLIGCTAATGASCTAQSPRLINPTKTASAGVSDPWKISVETWSGHDTGTPLDDGATVVATVESVQVLAHIEPNFTFTITGVANGSNLATGSFCGTTGFTTNSGITPTATVVNLGTLTGGQVNYAAQQLEVTSNSVTGYTITATSSGHLINPANGFFIGDAQGTPTANDTPSPTTIASTSNKYGIFACGKSGQTNQATSQWTSGSTTNFANPSQNFYYTLVNVSTSPSSSGDFYFVEYGASPASTTPPGDYRTTETYVATAIF